MQANEENMVQHVHIRTWTNILVPFVTTGTNGSPINQTIAFQPVSAKSGGHVPKSNGSARVGRYLLDKTLCVHSPFSKSLVDVPNHGHW